VLHHLVTLVLVPPELVPPSQVDDDLVTPGVWGFVVTFVVVTAVVLLIVDMVRRVRRVNYRAEVAALLDAEDPSDRNP